MALSWLHSFAWLQVLRAGCYLLVGLNLLCIAASSAADAMPAGGGPALAARLRTAEQAAQHAADQLPLAQLEPLPDYPEQEFGVLTQQYCRLLLPAAELGACLMERWALPDVAAERQVALAQAAAQRSCAFSGAPMRRCRAAPWRARGRAHPSAAAAGWPVTGELCMLLASVAARLHGWLWQLRLNAHAPARSNTTCSHADWLGPLGHRRACQALAAWKHQQRDARQAERERGAAAAGPAAGAPAGPA